MVASFWYPKITDPPIHKGEKKMARRNKNSLADAVVEATALLPWWAGVALAVVSYFWLHAMAQKPLTTALQPGKCRGTRELGWSDWWFKTNKGLSINKLCIWPSDLGCNARRKVRRVALLHKQFVTTQCAQSWRAKCACYLWTSPKPTVFAPCPIRLVMFEIVTDVVNQLCPAVSLSKLKRLAHVPCGPVAYYMGNEHFSFRPSEVNPA
jgi:hypothetical protein